MARAAYQLALANPQVHAEVIEVNEFPELAQRYGVRTVPLTVIADRVAIPGAVPDTVLMDIIERVVQPAGLAEAAPEAGPTTPTEQPKAAASGKIILP